MAEAKIEETVCEDMISALPDDLLLKILGLVPTKDAVATMFLSKRWFSIWTMVPTLEFKDSDDKSKKSVWNFLNKSLQLHKAPFIDTLCMELGPQCPTTEDVDVGLRRCVEKAVDYFVDKLIFKLLWSVDPISLPKSLYSCESLVTLTLSNQILVDVPSSAYLPSLTELELISVVYKDDDSVVSFLSSCPVLEFLEVQRREDDNVKNFTIKVPSLLELWYNNYKRCSIDAIDNTGMCLVLDAPAMTTCDIFDFSGDSYFIEYMPCLEETNIHAESYPGEKFLTSISSVSSLSILLSDATALRCSTIIFSQLIKLNLSIRPSGGGSDWLEPLLLLLGNAPTLKEFLLDINYIYEPENSPSSWNQRSHVPECLSSQLEILEWTEYGGRGDEEELLTYILANSKRLKTATISISLDVNLKEKKRIMDKLNDTPKVSTTCHVLFK